MSVDWMYFQWMVVNCLKCLVFEIIHIVQNRMRIIYILYNMPQNCHKFILIGYNVIINSMYDLIWYDIVFYNTIFRSLVCSYESHRQTPTLNKTRPSHPKSTRVPVTMVSLCQGCWPGVWLADDFAGQGVLGIGHDGAKFVIERRCFLAAFDAWHLGVFHFPWNHCLSGSLICIL